VDGLGELGSDPSIQRIGLRKMPCGLGEVVDVPRSDDDDGPSRRCTRHREGELYAAGRLSHHQRGSARNKAGYEHRDPRFRMCTGPVFPSRAYCHIELRFRTINPHNRSTWPPGVSCIGPALRDTGLRTAQATIRAWIEAGRDDPQAHSRPLRTRGGSVDHALGEGVMR